jgi:hypothetical protein
VNSVSNPHASSRFIPVFSLFSLVCFGFYGDRTGFHIGYLGISTEFNLDISLCMPQITFHPRVTS